VRSSGVSRQSSSTAGEIAAVAFDRRGGQRVLTVDPVTDCLD
jgi:hypothetical protein